MSIYQDCINAGIETDHHESDLYIPDTPETRAILAKYGKNPDGWNVQAFISEIDHTPCLDIPFQYIPFWDKVAKRSKELENHDK